jgi:hypothetical protein
LLINLIGKIFKKLLRGKKASAQEAEGQESRGNFGKQRGQRENFISISSPTSLV